MAHDIKEGMEIIGADGVHVGTVDRLEGHRIKPEKHDSHGASGTITISASAWSPASKASRFAFLPTPMSRSPSKQKNPETPCRTRPVVPCLHARYSSAGAQERIFTAFAFRLSIMAGNQRGCS